MKMNIAAAVAGGLIIGAASMVPLGSFAASEVSAPDATAPALDQTVPGGNVTVADPIETPTVPATPVTPPSFGAGGAGVGDDDEGDDEGDDESDDNGDDHDDEGDD